MKLNTGLQLPWILLHWLFSLPPDCRILKCKMYFYLKSELWTTEQQFSSSSPRIVSGLGVSWYLKYDHYSSFQEDVCARWPFQVLENTFLDNPLQTAVTIVACAPFPTKVFLSSQITMLCFDTGLCQQPAFSALLWLPDKYIDDHTLENLQVSNLLHEPKRYTVLLLEQ